MGCDIHCYLEYKRKSGWTGWSHINPGRDYSLFEKLAGVRGTASEALITPRGIPNDLGYDAQSDWWLLVSDDHKDDEGWCSEAYAKSWAKHGKRLQKPGEDGYKGSVPRIEHPDWHTPGWVTTKELDAVIQASFEAEYPTKACEYRALAAAMHELERCGFECRLVFWFDN